MQPPIPSQPPVLVTTPRPGIVMITFDRPPVNALDATAYGIATEALARADADPDVHVAILTGAGTRTFTAGTDLAAQRADSAGMSKALFGLFDQLASRRLAIVGALNGAAVGGGTMIAAECDVLIGVPGSYFLLPQIEFGHPGGGSHLRQLVPRYVALRMLLLRERLTIDEALALGVVWRIVEPAQLLDTAIAAAERIGELDPAARAAALELFRARDGRVTIDGLADELSAASRLHG